MLDGQGADELLAGYHGYPENRVQSLIDEGNYKDAMSLISEWSKWPGREPKYLKQSLAKYLLPQHVQHFVSRVVEHRRRPNFINRDYLIQNSFPDVYPENNWKTRRLSQRLLKEQTNGALVALLRHADRNSMRWSIESRVPFLNVNLSELVLSFPEKYLLSGQGETKSVFKEAMRGIVNQEVLYRKDKIGFATPQNMWITPNFLRKQSILDQSRSIDFLNNVELDKYLFSTPGNSVNKMNMTWRIFNLVKWRQISGIEK
jgi:asparagine synthase (glutamine-hydrolysing)